MHRTLGALGVGDTGDALALPCCSPEGCDARKWKGKMTHGQGNS